MRRRIIIITMGIFDTLQYLDYADLGKDFHGLIDRGQTHGRIIGLQYLINRLGIGMRRIVVNGFVHSQALRCYFIAVFSQNFSNFHFYPPFLENCGIIRYSSFILALNHIEY